MSQVTITKILKVKNLREDRNNVNIEFDNRKEIIVCKSENLQVDDSVIYDDNSKEIRGSLLYKEANRFITSDKFISKSNLALKINKFINRIGSFKFSQNTDDYNICEIAQKNINSIKGILESKESEFKVIKIKASILDKLIIGMGEPSIFENDITLHHTYGIPYIPGQAIKGALRNHIISTYFDLDETKAIKDEVFTAMFGNQTNEGKIMFLDSFPVKNFIIDVDVMTPHHPKYYAEGSNELPLDSDDPTPIKFLVVKDTTFEFNIAVSKEIINLNSFSSKGSEFINKIKNNIDLEEFIYNELKEVLEYRGLGAKTSVGYGYFKVEKADS